MKDLNKEAENYYNKNIQGKTFNKEKFIEWISDFAKSLQTEVSDEEIEEVPTREDFQYSYPNVGFDSVQYRRALEQWSKKAMKYIKWLRSKTVEKTDSLVSVEDIEKILKPEYMNDIFTWGLIKKALESILPNPPKEVDNNK